jgi:hypothetical protein
MVRIFLILLSLSICNILFGEAKTGYVDGDTPSVSVTFDSPVDYSYTLSAAPKGGWVFTDEFYYPSGNGWYRSGGYSISCEQLEGDGTTVFVDAASVFTAGISGRMYIPGSEGGSLIGWNVTGSGGAPVNVFIEPATAILPTTGGEREFTYRSNNLNLNFGALWKYTGMNIEGENINTNWNSGGNIFTFPNLKAGTYQLSAARNSNGALSALANITLVQVKSLSATANGITVTSTTDSPGDEESICIDAKQVGISPGSVTITATPEPGTDWPLDQPIWSINGATVQTGCSSYTFAADNKSPAAYTVSVECGSSKVAIKVYVTACSYIISLTEPVPGSGQPIDAFSVENKTYNIGHVVGQIAIKPANAQNVRPLQAYSSALKNNNFGLHPTDKSEVILSGATQGFIRTNDSLNVLTSYHIYPINLSQTQRGIYKLNHLQTHLPIYYLAQNLYWATVPAYTIRNNYSYNCASLPLDVGSHIGLPSGYGAWVGSLAGVLFYFEGDSPGFLGLAL